MSENITKLNAVLESIRTEVKQERCGKQKLDRIEAAVKARNDPVQSYRTIHQILAERN